ncbi:MAG: hypothetical protein AAGE52_11595 [Myxococcota bacterium]
MRSWMAASMVLAASTAFAQPQFEARDGFVVMEMESVPIPSGHEWAEESSLAGASGTYYRFFGNGICNGPAEGPLRYTFRISEGGTYALHLRAARMIHCVDGTPNGSGVCEEGDRGCTSRGMPSGGSCPSGQCRRTDISNDAFVRLETASGEYIDFDGQPGATSGRDIKLFGGGNDSWGWTGRRSLDISGKHDAEWTLEPGDYTLVMNGRSGEFRIDRIAFFDVEAGRARDADELEETPLTPPPPMDAGPGDAGPGEDAGSDPMDAGTAEDAGGGVDSGPGGRDSGPGERDAGVPTRDASTADDGGIEPTSGGGCSATGAAGGAWAALLVLGIRRRR